ncbi:unnamed protein product [Rhodiola kirilowii]
MSPATRQLQRLRHSPCSSNLFPNGAKLNKYSIFVDFRVLKSYSMSTQGLNLSSELVSRRNKKPLIISAYQSSWQNHDFRGRESKSPKHSADLSYIPKVLEDGSLAVNGPLPYVPEANNNTGRSTLIHNLFSQWLTKLHNCPQPIEIVEGISRTSEQLECSVSPGTKVEMHKRQWDTIREVVSCCFSRLDATLKITMLIFIPCYVAIRVIYGVEVLKELTPLWILGPLIVAFDIKMFQAISQLYVFCFKQAEIAIRSMPSPNKLTEAMYTYILHTLVAMTSFDYKKAAKMKLKEIIQWNKNVPVIFLTLSWPFYWRIVRFLTRSNLI